MKYSQWIGILACIVISACGFFPWTYHADLKENFTGFYSKSGVYGRPGVTFIAMSIFAIAFFLIPKIWAKRWNFLFSALILAYAIKTFILYTGCYNGTCPTKLPGIWIMLLSAVTIMAMAVLPDTKVPSRNKL
ncbi:MAG: hypothetical protein EOO04_12755 [Chitinophagaceae bacterium]|nr:MAG: hypothetical protein EOO04_12755 [Chitinophagaceae bacterium]